MFLPLLALSLASGSGASPSRLDRLREALAPTPIATSVVVLDCRVSSDALTDCQAESDATDSGRVAEAMRLSAAIVVPQALADSGAGRIKIKLNIAP